MTDINLIRRKEVAETTARAFEYVGQLEFIRTDSTEWYDLAKSVRQWGKEDPEDDMCCPVCQEMQCDGGCPLALIRGESD